ncbi:MAG: rhomboid family intramembrane serine protease [Bacteroidia bacterium]|nr:rhomboid family intramembrane serine protease [Bacteroidia bacterium]MDW8158540.1 rhomboid family intramembrane serine protease [Bacteroidia bacterium]
MIDYVHFAPVTSLILVVTIATTLFDFWTRLSLQDKFILHPYSVVGKKEWYRLLTSALIHGNYFHLLINMFVFESFAYALEKYRFLSSWKLAFVYVLSIVGGNIPLLIKNYKNRNYYALGASGGVSGIIFSFIAFRPLERFYLWGFWPLPAWAYALLFIFFSYYVEKRFLDNVAHSAHLWGALTGLVTTFLLIPGLWQYFIASLSTLL